MSHLTVWLYHFMSETPDNVTLILKPRDVFRLSRCVYPLSSPELDELPPWLLLFPKQVRNQGAPALNRRTRRRRP